jgi:CheY-like chemotaxis protein
VPLGNGHLNGKNSVVEDERISRAGIVEYLRAHGYEVSDANNGASALELFQAKPFDLVITDLTLSGLDGFQVIERIRSISPDVPVILISGYLPASVGKPLLRGPAEFIAKPFGLEFLLETIKRLLQLSVFRLK